jgi:hypothetical protein
MSGWTGSRGQGHRCAADWQNFPTAGGKFFGISLCKMPSVGFSITYRVWHGFCKVAGIAGEWFAGTTGNTIMTKLDSLQRTSALLGSLMITGLLLIASIPTPVLPIA